MLLRLVIGNHEYSKSNVGHLFNSDAFNNTKLMGELIKRPPAVVYEDNALREAMDLMVEEDVGRLPVVTRLNPRRVIAMVSQSDILSANAGASKRDT